MADTQRSKAQLLALFADNETGQISAQDLRDFLITVMESEFLYAGDFWKQPAARYSNTDEVGRGWIDYSQTVGSDVSFLNILYMTTSGEWMRADVADSTKNGVLGVALANYTSDNSNANILRDGIVVFTTWSATLSNFVGRPIYLASGSPGSIDLATQTSNLIVGFIEVSDDQITASPKMRFRPEWAVKGV